MYISLDDLKIVKGGATLTHIWSELCWLYGGTGRDEAVRRSVADGLWYVTEGYVESTVVTHGPFDSLEQVEMLIRMGVIDEYKT